MSKSPVISLQDVSFSYEKTPILEQVTLSIEEGEFVGVFGPNGGGKTTLLRLLMGFLNPNKGKVSLLGTSPIQARTHIGYVPQATKVDKQFPITVEEVVQMGCLSKTTFWGLLPQKSKQKALEALEKVKMAHKKDSPFGHLSGGEAQRVLIARALASEPSILFLDEPTASVDPVAEDEILSILASLQGSLTILMVTHDLQTILQKVGKLLCVHRKVHTLAPSEVCEHYGLGLYHSPLIQTLRK
ncbi:MAG: metal ABC transporter ATP-binding protein [Chlamydiota bacterium]